MAKSGRSRGRPATSASTGHGAPKKRVRGERVASRVTVTDPVLEERHREQADRHREDRVVTCRSCGKRPGRPTAIIGQMMAAELCAECAALRKERIRLNRAAARGLRPGSYR